MAIAIVDDTPLNLTLIQALVRKLTPPDTLIVTFSDPLEGLQWCSTNEPDLLIVDSVQTVSSSALESAAGSPAQVREVASSLIRVAKERGVPVLLVGHVTKDGALAGPRLLEHMVDTNDEWIVQRTGVRERRIAKNMHTWELALGAAQLKARRSRPIGRWMHGKKEAPTAAIQQ